MSGRRRLLVQPNRRRRTADESGRAQQSPTPPPELEALPPYQALELPLDDAAVRSVAELANNRTLTRVYDAHLKKSAELLREAVGSVNDLYSERKSELQHISERRRERGGDQPSKVEAEIEKSVSKLTDAVPTMTQDIERAARLTIDMQIGLEDERDALTWTSEQTVSRQQEDRQRRIQHEQAQSLRAERAAGRHAVKTEGRGGGGHDMDDDNDDDDDDKDAEPEAEVPQPASVVELLRQGRETRAADYAQMNAYRKYGLNNDYIAFKGTWHDAMFPDGDVILPDATAWFDAAGQPAAYGPDGIVGVPGDEGGGGGDDDDLIVAREVISFKCPLMLITMTDPYKSVVCGHTFEKSGIMEYLRQGRHVCPQTGCDRQLEKSDLVPDKVMRRRIERAAENARRRDEEATSDIEAEDANVGQTGSGDGDADAKADASLIEGQARNVKRERFERKR